MSKKHSNIPITDGVEELFSPETYVRQPFKYDTRMVSDDTGLKCEDESLTVQADAEDCDINVIVKRFGVTGELPQRVEIPLQDEFAETLTYHEALNRIREADEAFMEMPAEVRQRFNHDAGAFVAFASDPKNRDEARTLGLLVPEETPKKVSPSTVTTREGTVQAPIELRAGVETPVPKAT